MIAAQDALQRLSEGNQRFVSGIRSKDTIPDEIQRIELLAGQKPFAIILGCSDSRVPAELIFGQGVGDLFVIRIAGNIVAPSQVGSVEFAAEQYGVQLVVVMGHTHCGAVTATLDDILHPTETHSRNVRAIVERIRPSVAPLLSTELRHDHDALLNEAIRTNVRVATDHLRHGSEILEQLIQKEKLLIIGAEYSLETGVVDFFDGVPAGH
jgi:carbonic anhydrase